MTPVFAHPCIPDFRYQQRHEAHHLRPWQIRLLREVAMRSYSEGDPTVLGPGLDRRREIVAEGWRLLSGWGDSYAARAEQVVAESRLDEASVFHRIVRDHWLNSVGEDRTRDFFTSVARTHFKQYLEIIMETGNWPDSDQILNSYLTATRLFRLPDIVAFDSAWRDSGVNRLISWQRILHLDRSRIVKHSVACTDTDSLRALAVIFHDFIDLL